MRPFLLVSALLVITTQLGYGQTSPIQKAAAPAKAAAPRSTPRPRPPFASSRSLMETGAFEAPRVAKRTLKADGGDPLPYSQGEFLTFAPNAAAKDGTILTGLTPEQAHTGRQSLYIEFRHQTAHRAELNLATRLFPVLPDNRYHVTIWGRSDAKNPITIDQRLPQLRVEIDFYQADGETQTGESIIRTQAIPGTPNRPLLFPTDQWGEFFVDAKSPEDAAFIKVTWSWLAGLENGETNGVVYFDDANIEGEKPPEAPEPAETPTPTPAPAEASASPAPEAAAPTQAPAPATPKPSKRK